MKLFERKRDFCCYGFEQMTKDAGTRGFGIFTFRENDGTITFILQHRSMEPGSLHQITSEKPISLVSELHIRFCPFCGSEVHDFYKDRALTFERRDLRIGYGFAPSSP